MRVGTTLNAAFNLNVQRWGDAPETRTFAYQRQSFPDDGPDLVQAEMRRHSHEAAQR